MSALTLRIDRIGHAGDGIAEGPDGPLYVPFTLPGETVTMAVDGNRGAVTAIVEASPERAKPPCRHFGECGGCALQHMAPDAYRSWKYDQVVVAFAQRGIETDIAALVPCSPASRRRAVLTAVRQGKDVLLGFNRAGSHEVTAIEGCQIVVPAIEQRLDAIAALVAPMLRPKRRGRVIVLAADNGLDIAIDGLDRVDERALAALPGRIEDAAIARVTVAGEVIYLARAPELAFNGTTLLPPPGAFIQAVATAESAMSETILRGIGPAARVADLFCGIGTFTARIAAQAAVTAIDGDRAAISALDNALRKARGLKPVSAMRRDLFTDPMGQSELRSFDAVVFDPPRAGAKAQAEQLAASSVPRVVAVSCNPATLARDARILIDGGYRLMSVTPIDQFLWSAHIEAVATFER